MLRFLVLGVIEMCAILAGISVSVYVEEGIVMHLSICLDSTFLPPESVLIVEALCGVGEN